MSKTTKEGLQELINAGFPIEPLFNKVIITLDTVESVDGLELETTMLSDTQYIVAKGGSVTQLAEGDKVIIDIEKLMVPVRSDEGNAYETRMQVKIDPIEVDGVMYAIIEDRVIKAKDKR